MFFWQISCLYLNHDFVNVEFHDELEYLKHSPSSLSASSYECIRRAYFWCFRWRNFRHPSSADSAWGLSKMDVSRVGAWAAHSGPEHSWCVPRCKHVAAWVQVSHPSPPCRCTGVQRRLHTNHCLTFTDLHTHSRCKAFKFFSSLSFRLSEANNQLQTGDAQIHKFCKMGQ